MLLKKPLGWLYEYGQHLLILTALFLAAVGVRQLLSVRAPILLAEGSWEKEGAEGEMAAKPEGIPAVSLTSYLAFENRYAMGIRRKSLLHTDAAQRGRQEILHYTVKTADNIVTIARKYSLKPSTILWANYDVLRDDPHRIRPGQSLVILPADGAAYEWHSNDSLESVATFYHVPVQAILQWSGNHITSYNKEDGTANISSSTLLFIPGGKRDFVTRTVPYIGRENPKAAQIVGNGFCEALGAGPVGSGTLIFPTQSHLLDGYDYVPEANHYGIDLKGAEGDQVVAVDHGMVVYAGWNEWGYGNLVVVDHGKGWQSLYAHLSGLQVVCGDIVYQGDPIGVIGSSGSTDHANLHFELLHETLGRVTPWDYLPKEAKVE